MKAHTVHHKAKHAVRHVTHSPRHKTKTARSLKLVLVVCVAVLVLVCGGIVFKTVEINKNSDQLEAQIGTIDALLQKSAAIARPNTITSTLGFRVTYNKTQLTATGQSSDSASVYTESQLTTSRPYSTVTISTRIQQPAKTSVLPVVRPTMVITADTDSNYWADKLINPAYADKSKIEILADVIAKERGGAEGVTVSDPQDVLLNGVPYKQIIITHTNSTYGIDATWQEYVYVAVQHNRPYVITISPITSLSASELALFQSVLEGISYQDASQTRLSHNGVSAGKVAGVASAADLPETTTKTPYDVEPSTIINVILRNQPAVVRISTVYCADVDLLLPDHSVGLSLQHACSATVGSGSIVSSDGYIATNGHVVSSLPSDAVSGYPLMSTTEEVVFRRLAMVLKYMISAKILSEDEVTALLNAASNKDADAILVLSTLGAHIPDDLIHAQNPKTSYAVQTSATPIQYDLAAATFTYTNSVLPATLIGTNFDASQMKNGSYSFGSSDASDVAILKMDGSFPLVKLGNIIKLQAGDDLTAIGFPVFSDGGLTTTLKTTPPTVTQGTVTAIGSETGDTHKLLFTTVPIAQGNSGGPAFDSNGLQVALNTYSDIKCADHECFGQGVARDIADYRVLLTENHITLQTNSKISTTWEKGLTAYSEGNYRGAVKSFSTVARLYPAHYLASSMAGLAVSKYNSPSDTSDGIFTRDHLVRFAQIIGGIVLVVGVGLIGFLVHGSLKHGMVAPTQPSVPSGGMDPATPSAAEPSSFSYYPQPIAAPLPRAQQGTDYASAYPAQGTANTLQNSDSYVTQQQDNQSL